MCIFKQIGYEWDRQKGSHIILECKGKRPLVIPDRKEIPVGIIKSNLNTAGISRDEYFEYLRKC